MAFWTGRSNLARNLGLIEAHPRRYPAAKHAVADPAVDCGLGCLQASFRRRSGAMPICRSVAPD